MHHANLSASCFGERQVSRSAVGAVAGSGADISDQHGAAAPNASMLGPKARRRTVGQGRALQLSGTSEVPVSMFKTIMDGMRCALHNKFVQG